jgi:hypothetical protein
MDIEHIAIKEDYEIMDLMTPQILAKIIEWSKQGRDEELLAAQEEKIT